METTPTLLITIFIIFIVLIYRLLTKNQRYWKKLGVPCINSSVPYVGSMWPVLIGQKSLADVYLEIYSAMPHASMVGYTMTGTPELMVRDPELIKTVLQTNFHSNFNENGAKVDIERDPLLSVNPFFNNGEKWKSERTVLTNNMSTAKLKNMSLAVRDVCTKFSKYLEQEVKLNNGKFETEAQTMFSRFTGEVVASAGFGVDGRCFTNEPDTFQKMGEMMFESSGLGALKLFIAFFFPSLSSFLGNRFIPKKADQYFRGVVKNVLHAKQNGAHGNDFIQQLTDYYKSETGEIDELFVAGHATSFFVDGYLTSSHTLGYISFYVALYSEIQKKLRDEVNDNLQKYGEVNYDMIQDLKYMDQVIKEAMRLKPVVAVMQKKCTEKIKLSGADGIECIVNPGDTIDICPLGVQMDPKYWRNPETFDPERFSNENKNDYDKFVYIPFGGGPRACPGMRMAFLQLKGALITLLRNYTLELSSKTQLPLKFEPKGFMNFPKGGIWLNIKPLTTK